jgi:EAL domain-containing protein (putative c-di-GMP-specific phosphodiesterase class I)
MPNGNPSDARRRQAATGVLAIAMPGAARLEAIFGERAARLALRELGDAADALIRRLLAQHEILEHHRQDAAGRWSVLFRLRRNALARDLQETCGAIEAAGRGLAQPLPAQVLGAGTGMRMPLGLLARPLAADAWAAQGGQCPPGWLQPDLLAPPGGALEDGAAEAVAAILAGRQNVRTLLQPIVRMRDRAVVGYEALSRGPQGSVLEQPDRLFAAAGACGRTVDMELHCAALALRRTRGRLPQGRFLALNLGPQALACAMQRLPLQGCRDVLFELTEHLPLDGAMELSAAVAGLRAQGFGLALDDTGCGFADLDTARVLRPGIAKLCITVVRHAGQGTPLDADIAGSVAQLHQLGCRVLAEGVETQAQHDALCACGIELAQGWLYGRPAAVDDVLPPVLA